MRCRVVLEHDTRAVDAGQERVPTSAVRRESAAARTAASIDPAAALVRSSADGHRCAYVFSVVVAFSWPMARCTVTTSQPAAMRPEA